MVYFGGNTSGQILAVYLLLMLFWGVQVTPSFSIVSLTAPYSYSLSQVLKNLVHVTIAGSFASWYFRYPKHQATVNSHACICTLTHHTHKSTSVDILPASSSHALFRRRTRP